MKYRDSSGLALHAITAVDWLEKLGYSEHHRLDTNGTGMTSSYTEHVHKLYNCIFEA